jgi:SAM-dependent methyltransferase
VHCELQRLWEEFEQGPRLLGVLRPLVEALRAEGRDRRIRIVDIGCGGGFGTRWLAARGGLGDEVELVGVDYNAALVRFAEETAAREKLRCRFQVANAFRLEEPATIFTSTGVVHHFRGPDLVSFFREQAECAPRAFLHFDLKPTYLTGIGAWLFHKARMREPLSHHDGILSAARSYPAAALLGAARAGATPRGYATAMIDAEVSWLPLVDIFHALVGLEPSLRGAYSAALGDRLGAFA